MNDDKNLSSSPAPPAPSFPATPSPGAPARENRFFDFDYKNPLALYAFLEGAKIQSARGTGLKNKQQRQLRKAIKKARNLGLLPTHYQSYDDFGRPEPISPRPFDCK